MAKIKCYDPNGTEYIKESVDAKECIAVLGYTLEIPKEIPRIEDEEKGVEKKTKKGK